MMKVLAWYAMQYRNNLAMSGYCTEAASITPMENCRLQGNKWNTVVQLKHTKNGTGHCICSGYNRPFKYPEYNVVWS